MGQVINFDETLDQAAGRIRKYIFNAKRHDINASQLRLQAGEALLAIRPRVETAGLKWIKWCDENISRSRRDIQRLLTLAKAENPEAALDKEREDTRNRVAKIRGTYVRPITEGCNEATLDCELIKPTITLVHSNDDPEPQDTFRYCRLIEAWNSCTAEEKSRFRAHIREYKHA